MRNTNTCFLFAAFEEQTLEDVKPIKTEPISDSVKLEPEVESSTMPGKSYQYKLTS